MPYFVEIRVKPECDTVPESIRTQHIAFLDENIQLVLAGGGLFDDSETKIHGGFYILDIDDRTEAEALVARDPYITNDVFEVVQVSRWRKAYFDNRRLI